MVETLSVGHGLACSARQIAEHVGVAQGQAMTNNDRYHRYHDLLRHICGVIHEKWVPPSHTAPAIQPESPPRRVTIA